MRIAYCGHSYHRTTKSTEFLQAALKRLGDVDEYWDEEWLGKPPLSIDPIVEGRYDAVVVLQLVAFGRRLAAARVPNVTLLPMYDGCAFESDSAWRSLMPVKIVSFSRSLHERLQRLGLVTRHVAYAVDPASCSTVDHRLGLAGFFWQRKQEITWRTIRPLIEGSPFERFTLHLAVDPGDGEPVLPAPEDEVRFNVRKTRWHASREDARADLMRHTVYFAPRLREGIGMSFLEAMAMGMLVVAPDQPTMNEYVISGVNGLLYDPERPTPLDYSARASMGARARATIEQGWESWSRSRDAMLDFVLTPSKGERRHAPLRSFDPLAIDDGHRLPARSARTTTAPAGALEGGRRLRSGEGPPEPQVTVAVVAFGEEAALAPTLDSVLAQDHPSREIIVLDGLPRDGALDVVRAYDQDLDYWRARREPGRHEAMNEAARVARGRHLVFLSPGDRLLTTDALSRALDGAPADADVIYGDRVCQDELGLEDLHRAADFRDAWRRLRTGDVGLGWRTTIPGQQAVLLRTELLRSSPYRTDLRLGAHLELLCRLARDGARFHHSLATIAATHTSSRGERQELEDWRRVALEYTSDPERLRRAFAEMRAEYDRAELPHLTAWALLARVGRVPGASRALKRRLRSFSWRRLTGGDRRELRLGEDQPRGLRYATGLSNPEGWGCWTDGRLVTLELDPALVASADRVVLAIQHVFGPNVGHPLVLRIGPHRQEHVLQEGAQQVVLAACDALRQMDQPRIELEVPCASSPRELGMGEDPRQLGIGLERLVVECRHRR